MHAYKNYFGGSHLLIKKFVKIHKCHRNILDQDVTFLEKIVVKIEQHAVDVKEERESIAAEMRESENKVEPNCKIMATEIFFKYLLVICRLNYQFL